MCEADDGSGWLEPGRLRRRRDDRALVHLIRKLPAEMKLHVMRYLPFEKVHWALRDIPYLRNEWSEVHGDRRDGPATAVMERLRSLASVLVVREGGRLHGTAISLRPGVYRMKVFVQDVHLVAHDLDDSAAHTDPLSSFHLLLAKTDDVSDAGGRRTSRGTPPGRDATTGSDVDVVDGYSDGAFSFRRMEVGWRREYVLEPAKPYLTVCLGPFGSTHSTRGPSDTRVLSFLDEGFRCFGFAVAGRRFSTALRAGVDVFRCGDGSLVLACPYHDYEARYHYSLMRVFSRSIYPEIRHKTFWEYREELLDFIEHSLRPDVPERPETAVHTSPGPGADAVYLETTIALYSRDERETKQK